MQDKKEIQNYLQCISSQDSLLQSYRMLFIAIEAVLFGLAYSLIQTKNIGYIWFPTMFGLIFLFAWLIVCIHRACIIDRLKDNLKKLIDNDNVTDIRHWHYLSYGKGSTKECRNMKNLCKTFWMPFEKLVPRLTFNFILPFMIAFLWWWLWNFSDTFIIEMVHTGIQKNNDILKDVSIYSNNWLSIIATLILPIMTLILGIILTYIFVSIRELRTAYLLKFEEWCSRLYGEIVEIKERYFDKNNFTDNPILIISDYRELHDRLIDTPRWRSRMEKEDETLVAKCLKELTDLIDKGWHDLQCEFMVNFQTYSNKNDWLEQIIREPKKDEIGKKIKNEQFQALHNFFKMKKMVEGNEMSNIDIIKEYLKNKVPRKLLKLL